MTDKPHIPTQFTEPVPMPEHDRTADDVQLTASTVAYAIGIDPDQVPDDYVRTLAQELAQKETFGPRASFPLTDAPERDEEAAAAVPAAAPPPPAAAPPVPAVAGTFAVYDDDRGGIMLVIGTADGQTHHRHIPAAMVKMGEKLMGGGGPLGALFGLGG